MLQNQKQSNDKLSWPETRNRIVPSRRPHIHTTRRSSTTRITTNDRHAALGCARACMGRGWYPSNFPSQYIAYTEHKFRLNTDPGTFKLKKMIKTKNCKNYIIITPSEASNPDSLSRQDRAGHQTSVRSLNSRLATNAY